MDLSGNNPATADGTYSVTDIEPGRQYLCTIFGTWGGGTITVRFLDPVSGESRDSANNTFNDDAEFTLLVPSNAVDFVLSGATAPAISIALTPIRS